MLVLFFRGMGKARGEGAGALAPGLTMPVPLIMERGQQRRMLKIKLFAWPPSLSVASGTGQTLQDDPLPDHAGRVGGEGPEK